jgi:SSS family solute:Na+ symporter
MTRLLSSIDWTIIAIYLIAVVGLGVVAGSMRRRDERGGEGGHYFLAGRTLTWPVIGLAMFAANISTVHLVSLAEAAYKYGLVYGNFEWMAGFTLILLSLVFAPLYVRSRVTTAPDFLERRFNRSCRDILSIISLFSAIVIHMGVALYTAAWVLRGMLGLMPGAKILGVDALFLFIAILGILTGVYTMIGGLLAVVWTESAQTILLLVGAVVITIAAYQKIGGWTELAHALTSHPHPLANVANSQVTWGTGNFLSVIRDSKDPSGLAWYSILLGYPVIGIWYFCCDQTIVQRVLAAKDEKNARLGPLFCAFLKIFPVFLFVLPGVICVALVQKNLFNGAEPQTAADTYTFMLTHLLPIGLKGLVAAALLAAAMQTCSAALNSTATLVAYDLFKRYRPGLGDHQLVRIGKMTTIVGTILAIIASPLFGHYTTIFEGINKLISYVSPPVTAVFLLGIFWRRASSRAAFITLVAGIILGFITFLLDWNNIYRGDFMLMAFWLLISCLGIMVLATFIFPEPLKDEARELVWQNWRDPLRGKADGRGLANYRLAALAVLIVFVILFLIFR